MPNCGAEGDVSAAGGSVTTGAGAGAVVGAVLGTRRGGGFEGVALALGAMLTDFGERGVTAAGVPRGETFAGALTAEAIGEPPFGEANDCEEND